MDVLPISLNQMQAAKYEYSSRHICDWSENPRPFSTLALMRKGSGRFVSGDKAFDVLRDQTFFIPAGLKYISYWYGDNEILYYAIHFHFDNWNSPYAPQMFQLQQIVSLGPEQFLQPFEEMCRYMSEGGTGKLKACGEFYKLYSEVIPLMQRAKIRDTALESVKAAVDFIEANSEKNFSVKYLAQMCSLSESRFYALFSRALGCPPIAYRNSVRVRKAMTLLGGEDSIDEIAEKTGFSSPVHFRQVFKSIMGKLPSAYRKTLMFG